VYDPFSFVSMINEKRDYIMVRYHESEEDFEDFLPHLLVALQSSVHYYESEEDFEDFFTSPPGCSAIICTYQASSNLPGTRSGKYSFEFLENAGSGHKSIKYKIFINLCLVDLGISVNYYP